LQQDLRHIRYSAMPNLICPHCAYEGEPGFVVLEQRPDGRTLAPCPECGVVRQREPEGAFARFPVWSEAEILAHITAALGSAEQTRTEFFAAVTSGALRMEGQRFTGAGWSWSLIPTQDWVDAFDWAGGIPWFELPDSLSTGFHFSPSKRWGNRRAPRADVQRLWPPPNKRRSQRVLSQIRDAAIEAAIKQGTRPGKNYPWGTFENRLRRECGAQEGEYGFGDRQIKRLVKATLKRLGEI
jgi:hypothetical protein